MVASNSVSVVSIQLISLASRELTSIGRSQKVLRFHSINFSSE